MESILSYIPHTFRERQVVYEVHVVAGRRKRRRGEGRRRKGGRGEQEGGGGRERRRGRGKGRERRKGSQKASTVHMVHTSLLPS